MPFIRGRKSPRLTGEMAARIKALLRQGVCQHDIAAHLGVNQGRVSEVNTGKIFPQVPPAQLDLPFA